MVSSGCNFALISLQVRLWARDRAPRVRDLSKTRCTHTGAFVVSLATGSAAALAAFWRHESNGGREAAVARFFLATQV